MTTLIARTREIPVSKGRSRFLGRWRITATDLWARRDLDELAPAHITFGPARQGELEPVAIEGDIDYRLGRRDGKPAVEFSWQGSDDGQPISGRGWAQLSDRRIDGQLFIHQGDDTRFTAEREPSPPTRKRPRAARRPR